MGYRYAADGTADAPTRIAPEVLDFPATHRSYELYRNYNWVRAESRSAFYDWVSATRPIDPARLGFEGNLADCMFDNAPPPHGRRELVDAFRASRAWDEKYEAVRALFGDLGLDYIDYIFTKGQRPSWSPDFDHFMKSTFHSLPEVNMGAVAAKFGNEYTREWIRNFTSSVPDVPDAQHISSYALMVYPTTWSTIALEDMFRNATVEVVSFPLYHDGRPSLSYSYHSLEEFATEALDPLLSDSPDCLRFYSGIDFPVDRATIPEVALMLFLKLYMQLWVPSRLTQWLTQGELHEMHGPLSSMDLSETTIRALMEGDRALTGTRLVNSAMSRALYDCFRHKGLLEEHWKVDTEQWSRVTFVKDAMGRPGKKLKNASRTTDMVYRLALRACPRLRPRLHHDAMLWMDLRHDAYRVGLANIAARLSRGVFHMTEDPAVVLVQSTGLRLAVAGSEYVLEVCGSSFEEFTSTNLHVAKEQIAGYYPRLPADQCHSIQTTLARCQDHTSLSLFVYQSRALGWMLERERYAQGYPYPRNHLPTYVQDSYVDPAPSISSKYRNSDAIAVTHRGEEISIESIKAAQRWHSEIPQFVASDGLPVHYFAKGIRSTTVGSFVVSLHREQHELLPREWPCAPRFGGLLSLPTGRGKTVLVCSMLAGGDGPLLPRGTALDRLAEHEVRFTRSRFEQRALTGKRSRADRASQDHPMLENVLPLPEFAQGNYWISSGMASDAELDFALAHRPCQDHVDRWESEHSLEMRLRLVIDGARYGRESQAMLRDLPPLPGQEIAACDLEHVWPVLSDLDIESVDNVPLDAVRSDALYCVQGGTLVVVPSKIQEQWAQALRQLVRKPDGSALSVCEIGSGVWSSRRPSPLDLASYEVVIATPNRFIALEEAKMVHWHRVVVDEREAGVPGGSKRLLQALDQVRIRSLWLLSATPWCNGTDSDYRKGFKTLARLYADTAVCPDMTRPRLFSIYDRLHRRRQSVLYAPARHRNDKKEVPDSVVASWARWRVLAMPNELIASNGEDVALPPLRIRAHIARRAPGSPIDDAALHLADAYRSNYDYLFHRGSGILSSAKSWLLLDRLPIECGDDLAIYLPSRALIERFMREVDPGAGSEEWGVLRAHADALGAMRGTAADPAESESDSDFEIDFGVDNVGSLSEGVMTEGVSTEGAPAAAPAVASVTRSRLLPTDTYSFPDCPVCMQHIDRDALWSAVKSEVTTETRPWAIMPCKHAICGMCFVASESMACFNKCPMCRGPFPNYQQEMRRLKDLFTNSVSSEVEDEPYRDAVEAVQAWLDEAEVVLRTGAGSATKMRTMLALLTCLAARADNRTAVLVNTRAEAQNLLAVLSHLFPDVPTLDLTRCDRDALPRWDASLHPDRMPHERIAVGTVNSCSAGINLTWVNHIVCASALMNDATMFQIAGRVHRYGQLRSPTFHILASTHGFDLNLLKVHGYVRRGEEGPGAAEECRTVEVALGESRRFPRGVLRNMSTRGIYLEIANLMAR